MIHIRYIVKILSLFSVLFLSVSCSNSLTKEVPLLLKGGMVANGENGNEEQADVLIVGNRIKAVGKDLSAEGENCYAKCNRKYHA